MDDETPDVPIISGAAVWTRADALRVGDRVLVRSDDGDIWAQVTRTGPTVDPDRLRLHLVPEVDGDPLGEHAHTTPTDTAFLRLLPGG